MSTTKLDDAFEFIDIVQDKGFWNKNTAQSRRTACTKLFSVLDDNQRTIEFAAANLDTIKTRFMNLHREVAGNSVEIYAQRAKIVLTEFQRWRDDRAGWERGLGKSAAEGEKTRKPPKKEKPARQTRSDLPPAGATSGGRRVSFPLRPGVEFTCEIPTDFTLQDWHRVGYGLRVYANEFSAPARDGGFEALSDAGAAASQGARS